MIAYRFPRWALAWERWRFSAWPLTWETQALLSMATAVEVRRIAQDGLPYTLEEFMAYYGENWDARWRAAPIASACGAPQPVAAADPSDGDTPGQQLPQAQAAPTNAGAPQPGAAAGPSDAGTPGQQPPQAQAAPTNAGAPQPGAALVTLGQWYEVPFFTEVLPTKSQ